MVTDVSCFNSYDVRGVLEVNFDTKIAYKISNALSHHFKAKKVVVGQDARESSVELAEAVIRGAIDSGANVLDLGLCGTEEMYAAVMQYNACAGVQITGSHNPIEYNGLKFVKTGAMPLDDKKDFRVIKSLVQRGVIKKSSAIGRKKDISCEARRMYIERILGLIDVKRLKPLKVLVNSGHGAAGPTVNALAVELKKFGSKVRFSHINDKPDHRFPTGIPNPLIKENQSITRDAVKNSNVDFGVAFDGDFDRCFFFDDCGNIVNSEYIIGLLADIFLGKHPGAKIIYDTRITGNILDVIRNSGGVAVLTKTGHINFKRQMKLSGAAYGGESSGHHYFRDFGNCDSGLIPLLLIIQLISETGMSLRDMIGRRQKFFQSSGEINFSAVDLQSLLKQIENKYSSHAMCISTFDGVSYCFKNWRFNIRKSNTENFLRLNLETYGNKTENMDELVRELTAIIYNNSHN